MEQYLTAAGSILTPYEFLRFVMNFPEEMVSEILTTRKPDGTLQ